MLKKTPFITSILLIIVLLGTILRDASRGNEKFHFTPAEVVKIMAIYSSQNFKAVYEIVSFNIERHISQISGNSRLSRTKAAERTKTIRENIASLTKEVLNRAFAALSSKQEETGLVSASAADSFTLPESATLLPAPEKETDFSCDFKGFKEKFSTAAALMYFEGGQTNAFAYNENNRWPIASISKLMAAVVAKEKMNLQEQIKISQSAVETYGLSGEFSVGEIFTLRDLMIAGLVVSSNDAIAAIAETYGTTAFVDEMQRKAREVGMWSTSYYEPTGLSHVNQSTASDLKKLAEYIYREHPDILKISAHKYMDITELSSGKKRRLYNVDRYAGEADFLGGKTGFIDEAGRNLLAFFQKDNQVVLTIVLGTQDSFAATDGLLSYLKTCRSNH